MEISLKSVSGGPVFLIEEPDLGEVIEKRIEITKTESHPIRETRQEEGSSSV